jgi:uncharacterized LabA/DUF88 family protein
MADKNGGSATIVKWKAKAVDIMLTKDLLSNAFLDNYDIAVLVAGDGDYVPVVNEIKRQGKIVLILFFRDFGLNPKLRLAADAFISLEDRLPGYMGGSWRDMSEEA